MPHNCYSIGFPSVHAYFLFLLSLPPWYLLRADFFFCSGLCGYPDIEDTNTVGELITGRNYTRWPRKREQERVCSNGGIRGNAPCLELGHRLAEGLCIHHLWPRGALLGAQKNPCFILEMEMNSFNSIQSSWVLTLFRVAVPTPAQIFPICFLVKCSK